jgi:hypothetical protein
MATRQERNALRNAMAARSPLQAAKVGIPLQAARNQRKADGRTGLLDRATRKAKGGHINGCATKGHTKAK